MRKSLLWTSWGAICLLVIVACVASPAANLSPEQRLYDSYGKQLELAVGVYTDALAAAKHAHDTGTLSDAQLQKIGVEAQKVQQALQAAKDGLILYLQFKTGTGPAGAIAGAQQALADLTNLLTSLKVLK